MDEILKKYGYDLGPLLSQNEINNIVKQLTDQERIEKIKEWFNF
jgi:hypothetical protein